MAGPKQRYEHMGFLFACGGMDFRDASGRERHTGGNLGTARKLGVVMVRIGAPRELDITLYKGDPMTYKRDLGAYISPRDLTQLFSKAIDTPHIENEHGIPWQVVYGISNNTRAFWLANARKVLGYEPEDDRRLNSPKTFRGFLLATGRPAGSEGSGGESEHTVISPSCRERLGEELCPRCFVRITHAKDDMMEYVTLGKTGLRVSGLASAAVWKQSFGAGARQD